MGVDYSAHLAYGVEAPELDGEKFPDGWWEYESYYADAMAKDLGVEIEGWEQLGQILREMPCPVHLMPFGDNYGGKQVKVLYPRGYGFSADQYGGEAGQITTIPQGNPTGALEVINDFLDFIGAPVVESEPQWYFGMYVS